MSYTTSDWNDPVAKRDLTLVWHADWSRSATLKKGGQPWTPPSGTTGYFEFYNPGAKTVKATWTGGIVGNVFSITKESADCDAMPTNTPFTFFISIPGTPSREIAITTGKVKRSDPA